MKNLFILLLLILLMGCASTPEKQLSVEEHFRQAEEAMAKEKYAEAISAWEKVLEAYESPQLNMLAELKIAESYYLNGDFPEAAASYEDFLKNHPDDGRTPDIIFQLGMSYYLQRLSHDRDQTATYNALVTFQSLIRNHPENSHIAAAKNKVASLRADLAEHEYYVGRFYFKTDKYQSAIFRFQELLKNYPDYPHQDKVYYYLGRSFMESEKIEKGVEAFNTLFRLFPDSSYVRKTEKYLPEN